MLRQKVTRKSSLPTPILQMRKLRPRVGKGEFQGHTVQDSWLQSRVLPSKLHYPILTFHSKSSVLPTNQLELSFTLYSKERRECLQKILMENVPGEEWINKTWHSCTVEYDSVTKKKQSVEHATVWMNLKNLILSERSQTQKATCPMSPFTWNIQSRSVHRDGKQRSGCQGLGEGEWGLSARDFPLGRMLRNWIKYKMRVIVQHCGYTKCPWTVRSKMANSTLCEIYLDKHTHACAHTPESRDRPEAPYSGGL